MEVKKKPGTYSGYTDARKAANARYEAETVERISLVLPKGKKATIKAHAEAQEESVNGFINRAIDETMEHDKTGSPQQPKAAPRPAAPAPEDSVAYLSPEALETAKEAAKRKGETVAGFLARAIATQANRDSGKERVPELVQQVAPWASALYLAPETLQAARAAAELTGESIADFVARAIDEAAKQDKQKAGG